ncbi:hypothetical protein RB619_18005 [Flavobacterium sp. LHD-80]|uniref:hypothetical protein n=1 Tax=Flavobacterium sp. LHD-80 TaxID=3071411 RepID=UPI0027DF9E5C|nr:hypothetical protein [Flavobacterium sp. LHD-80]MDQ6472540.1 hypothetical protein [Flavobacterium sp. LHD-80]
MRKITCMLLLIQSGFMMAQTKTVVTQNGEKLTISPLANNGLSQNNGYTQLGGALNHSTTIQTSSTNTLALSGLISSTDNNDAPIVVANDGTLKKGAFPVINIVPNEVGTVIAIDGKLEVAQEITAMMSSDFVTSGSGIIKIGNINNVIIDNKNKFIGNSSTNQFSVADVGTYLVTINVQLFGTTTGNPVIGIVDNNTGQWVARVNDGIGTNAYTFTLITSIVMDPSHTYSFGCANNVGTLTVRAFSTGGTGNGPISFFSVKRLK